MRRLGVIVALGALLGLVHDLLFTGAATASFTNLQTGKTITENIPRPGKATIHPDGSITEAHTGRNGPFILAPADAKRFGLPAVSVTAGALRFSVAANGSSPRCPCMAMS